MLELSSRFSASVNEARSSCCRNSSSSVALVNCSCLTMVALHASATAEEVECGINEWEVDEQLSRVKIRRSWKGIISLLLDI